MDQNFISTSPISTITLSNLLKIDVLKIRIEGINILYTHKVFGIQGFRFSKVVDSISIDDFTILVKEETEKQSKAFSSGKWICVCRIDSFYDGNECWSYTDNPDFINMEIILEHKLISKKHSDVLTAFMDGHSVDCINLNPQILSVDFIADYNPSYTYKVSDLVD